MARPEISEFSYGYAVTEESVRGLRQRRASLEVPFFPTLWQEGQPGFGFDVEIRALAILYQFKVPEYLTGSAAKQRDYFKGPYFRYALRTKLPDQHAMLIELEQARPTDVVRYIAPQFNEWKLLNRHYRDRTTVQASFPLSPTAIGAFSPPGRAHHIGYRVVRAGAPLVVGAFSAPRHIETSETSVASLLDGVASGFSQRPLTTIGDWLTELVGDLTRIARHAPGQQLPLPPSDEQTHRGLHALVEQAHALTRIAFGCELLLVLERQ